MWKSGNRTVGNRQKKLHIRFRGTIGDVLHYLARMKDVRSKYPEYWIKCIIASHIPYQLREVIELEPYIDEIEVLPPHIPGSVVSPQLQRKIESDVGIDGEVLDFVLPGYGDLLQFEIDQDWRPALSASDLRFADNFFDTYIGDAGLVTLHMASSRDKDVEWQWGMRKYQELVELIQRDYSHKILIVGDVSASFCQDGSILDLSSNEGLGITLREVFALIVRSDLVIGGDSGFQVLPWLCGIPVISLVPEYHIRGWARPNDGCWLGEVISVDMFLPDAYTDRSGSVILPVESASVDEVYIHVKRLLGEGRRGTSVDKHPVSIYVRRRYKPWIWIWYRTVALKHLRKVADFVFAPWYPTNRSAVVLGLLRRVAGKVRRVACGLVQQHGRWR